MRKFRLVIITGLPGTGKTTLARQLARTHGMPLICKDTIKEPLLDSSASVDASRSRILSNISFAVMFDIARELLALGDSLILEGNFRSGEHETALLASLPPEPPNIVQLLCQIDEEQRRRVLLARARDPARHAGHADAVRLERAAECAAFLELPGARRSYRVGSHSCETLF